MGTSDAELCAPHHDEVALVVVTYFPDDSFYDRAILAAHQFRVVIIVDNSGAETGQFSTLECDNIQIILNQNNQGLGHALNTGCRRALELGCKWVVTLDQDTELNSSYLPEMLSAWARSKCRPAVYGCNYYNVSRSHYRFRPSGTSLTEERKTVITSGCLMHLQTWSCLGEFKSDYFIDSIDHEFCLRARGAGHCVAINLQSLMVHTIGEKAKYHRAFKKFSPYTHSVWRVYTLTRNTTRTIIEYATAEPIWCIRQIAGLSFNMLAIIFLEPKKVTRLKAFATGLAHGYQNKMGVPHYELVEDKASSLIK